MMHPTHNDLPESVRKQVIALLNARLADAIDLGTQCKQAHWNVKGPNFIALHELFDEIHDRVQEHIDEIAERVVALGGTAMGTVAVVSKNTGLPAYPTDVYDGMAHVEAMAVALAGFARSVRAAIDASDEAGDAVTADLFTGIAAAVDKDLWFVEAHRQGR
jgi:starvation-inducible DNA-binding protein